MRRHFLFAEDEKERSVGEGKANLLRLWHDRRTAMLEGDESASGGEANAVVARELTLLWDLAKPTNACTLDREGYVGFFARAAKALVLPLSTDTTAIAAAERDWEYDLEGVGRIGKAASGLESEGMTPEQFREAVMQLADIVLPVESGVNVFVTFFQELRNSIAVATAPASSFEPEQDEANAAEPIDCFTLRPLNRIPKIANETFLQKLPPSSDTMRSIRGLQPPDQREMSLKQLLLCYNPRKFSLTRAFPKKKTSATGAATDVKEEAKTTPSLVVVDAMVEAKRLHMELVGSIGSGATPARGSKLHRESTALWDPEDALTVALADFPASRLAVVGPPGCGKTRLSRVLARRLGLKYLSLDEAVRRAVDRKLRARRQSAVPPPADGEDAPAEPPAEPTEEVEKAETPSSADTDEDMDRLFQDEDLDALRDGRVVGRGTALALLRLEASRFLLGTFVKHDSED
jgi:hypothetical protein